MRWSAKNETEARRGSIFASFLKLLPVFIFIIPGITCFALASSGKNPALQQALFESGKLVNENAQAAFPLMVQHVLPVGIRGIVVAGLLAALMSSLAGVFNASSTLFTMDLYKVWKPRASEHELVWMGRVATAVLVLIGLAWIPVIQNAKGLYFYLQGVQGYLAPPIFVVFFFGVFMTPLECERLPGRAPGRFPAGTLPLGRRYSGRARAAGLRKRLLPGVLVVGCQSHLLPILQRADLYRQRRGDGCRQLCHRSTIR